MNNNHQYIKRPLNAYMIWTVEQRQKIHKEPRQKMNEVSRAMGEVWKKMSDAEKAPYFEQAKKHAEEHKQALKDNPNLAYVPSRKKMRLSKNADKDNSTSNPSSPGDLSDIPESPALSSTRATSFAPMSPPLNIHQQHTLPRTSQGQITLAPRISYYHPITTANGDSLENHSTVRIIPANRSTLPPTQQGMIQLYEPNTYTVMAQQPNGHFQPQPQQSRAPPQVQAQTLPAPTTAASTAADQYLNPNQICERYYAALCQPQFPTVFEAPNKLRDANYYYDLHLQLHKKPL